MSSYRVVRADPAGNITLFVLTQVPAEKRSETAQRLFEACSSEIEQIGFAGIPDAGFDGRLEMAGGEFCGNASRAYGLLLAKHRGLQGRQQLMLQVSGSSCPIAVSVDIEGEQADAQMPLPRFVRRETVAGVTGTLVHLGGIVHFVVENIAPDAVWMERIEPLFHTLGALDAYGICFLERDAKRMTPLVKVPAARTLVFEGSCGSGSVASAVAMSEGTDGAFSVELQQPAGVVRAAVQRCGGVVTQASIGGSVTLGVPKFIEC